VIDVRHRGRIILAAYLLFCIIYLGAPLISIGEVHVLRPSFLDREIPFLPWTIAIYASQFVFLFLALWQSPTSEALKHILTAIAIATMISAAVFIVWPSAIDRPAARDAAFATLYFFDVPTNCFPSLHVALAMIAAATWPHAPTRVLAWIWAMAIAASTLTTKQHVLLDVAGGVIVGAGALVWSGAVERALRRAPRM
jgi:membrane-associated phospholipid phosphatase